MTISLFPSTPTIVITRAMVSATRTEASDGVSTVRHPEPVPTFFLQYVDDDHAEIVWDGLSHNEALAAARAWNVPVRDFTGGRS